MGVWGRGGGDQVINYHHNWPGIHHRQQGHAGEEGHSLQGGNQQRNFHFGAGPDGHQRVKVGPEAAKGFDQEHQAGLTLGEFKA